MMNERTKHHRGPEIAESEELYDSQEWLINDGHVDAAVQNAVEPLRGGCGCLILNTAITGRRARVSGQELPVVLARWHGVDQEFLAALEI
jgi:hypothetical protein